MKTLDDRPAAGTADTIAAAAASLSRVRCPTVARQTLAAAIDRHLAQGDTSLGELFAEAAATLRGVIRFNSETEGTFAPYLYEPLLGLAGAAGIETALAICEDIEHNPILQVLIRDAAGLA